MKYMGSHLKQMCPSVTQAIPSLSSKGKQSQENHPEQFICSQESGE